MYDLLEFDGVAKDWLFFLSRVSAKLYECDSNAWRRFELARKRFAEALGWLELEGEVDLANSNAGDAMRILKLCLPKAEQHWQVMVTVARAALGRTVLREILRS